MVNFFVFHHTHLDLRMSPNCDSIEMRRERSIAASFGCTTNGVIIYGPRYQCIGPISCDEGCLTWQVSVMALPTLTYKSAGPAIIAFESGGVTAKRKEKLPFDGEKNDKEEILTKKSIRSALKVFTLDWFY